MTSVQAKRKRLLANLAVVVAVTLALLWPAFVNGEPFYMPDTPSYIRGADGAIHELTGISSVWSGELEKRFPSSATGDPAASVETSVVPGPKAPNEPAVVLKGRSIYYGAFLYVAQLFGNFWAMAAFQGLLCSVAILLTVGQIRRARGLDPAPSVAAGIGILLAVLTPLGFFTTYLMPDVLGGLALLAVCHLILFWPYGSRYLRLFWFAVLTFAVVSHAANVLLVGAVAALASLGLAVKLPISRHGLGTVACALIIALVSQLMFAWGVKHATGEAPVRPPFLAARIIEDGPGFEYLQKNCPEVRLIYCRTLAFARRDSDALLWSENPKEGIFQALPAAEQRMAASQQTGFVLAVFKERPFALLRSSAQAFFQQLIYFKLESFNYTHLNDQYFDRKLPSPFIENARQSKAYQQKMPVRAVEWATVVSVISALGVIFWTLRAIHRSRRPLSAPAAFLVLLLLGVLLNAAICGAFSTPRGRYEMRLIWVLPLAAWATCRVRVRRLAPSGAESSAVVAAS